MGGVFVREQGYSHLSPDGGITPTPALNGRVNAALTIQTKALKIWIL